MKRLHCFVWIFLIALTVSGTVHAKNDDTDAKFWFLKPGTDSTPENRIKAIQNTGTALLDFAVYQPTGTFPEDDRKKLLDAGFVFDFLTSEEQLASLEGDTGILVIPENIPFTTDDIRRLKDHIFAFLGASPELPEPIPLTQEERQSNPLVYLRPEVLDKMQTTITKKSFADWKKEIETEQKRMRDRLAASPNFAGKSDEEIDATLQRMPMMTPRPGDRIDTVMDRIGNNLVEALGLLKACPENLLRKPASNCRPGGNLRVKPKTVAVPSMCFMFSPTRKRTPNRLTVGSVCGN